VSVNVNVNVVNVNVNVVNVNVNVVNVNVFLRPEARSSSPLDRSPARAISLGLPRACSVSKQRQAEMVVVRRKGASRHG
jgi:hypothetical protein